MNGLDKKHCIVLKDGKFDTDSGTSADHLRGIFKAIRQTENMPVVVHFHGGLVDKQAGITGANTLIPIYQNAGAYPIFFVWETGWQEVIQQNLPEIFKENIFQRILLRVTQFAKGKIDKGIETGQPKSAGDLVVPKDSKVRDELNNPADGHEPFANVDSATLPKGDELTDAERKQFEEKLKDDPVFEMAAADISGSLTPANASQPVSRGATVRGSTKTLMSPEVLDEFTTTEEGSKGLFSTALLVARCSMVLAKVINRFAKDRDHGFFLTIVEEILRAFYLGNAGRFVWDSIKQDTIDGFGVAPDCGGSLFLAELESLWKSGNKPHITIVGHSAGAIYACRLLQEVQSRGLPEDLHFNFVLIAPACDFELLAKTLQSAGNRIDGLRIFGMDDNLERKDEIVPLVYPSSLLYLVSGVIEKEQDCPLAGMARYYSAPYDDAEGFPNIDYVRKFALFQKGHALVWATSTAGDGFNCDMTSHGGWVGTKATVASVVHIIEKGYEYDAGTGRS